MNYIRYRPGGLKCLLRRDIIRVGQQRRIMRESLDLGEEGIGDIVKAIMQKAKRKRKHIGRPRIQNHKEGD